MIPVLNRRMRAVLSELEHAADADGCTRISMPKIAAATRYSVPTIRLAFRELRAAGAIRGGSAPGQSGSMKQITGIPMITATPEPKKQHEGVMAPLDASANDKKHDIFGCDGNPTNATIPPVLSTLNLTILAWKWVNSASRVYLELSYLNLCTDSIERKKENLPNPPFFSSPTPNENPLPAQSSLPPPQTPARQKKPPTKPFPTPPGAAMATVGTDLFGAPVTARNGDLVELMANEWNTWQEEFHTFWRDLKKPVVASRISPSLRERMLRAWHDNNLNLGLWRVLCRACTRNTSLAGLDKGWDGATLGWLVRPDRDNIVDVLNNRYPFDFDPTRVPGS